MSVVQSLWHGEVAPRPGGKALMRTIVAEVAAEYGVTVDAIMCTDRHVRGRPVWARHEAMLRIYQTRRFSTPRIGQFFDRDHSTVIYSMRLAEERGQNGSFIAAGQRLPHPASADLMEESAA